MFLNMVVVKYMIIVYDFLWWMFCDFFILRNKMVMNMFDYLDKLKGII